MANPFTQLHIHFVFGVLYRERILEPKHSEVIRKYITGIVQSRKHKMLFINNVPDHLHMLVGFHPTDSPSEFIKTVKTSSSKFINDQSWMKFRFNWEDGYGAFSVSHKEISNVASYIEKQEDHHKRISFSEEFEILLRKHDIAFNRKYIF